MVEQKKRKRRQSDEASRHEPKNSPAGDAGGASDTVKEPQIVIERGLFFPQPKVAPQVNLPPLDILPEWLRNPVEVPMNPSVSWNDLLENKRTRENLSNSGYKLATGIQAGVIPMLGPGPSHYNGDVCIASGTGTGKTIAFMAPMIDDLANGGMARLRGLVIVPTREAVAQTLAVANICVAKSGLKIGTGRGSKEISQERRLLLRKVARLEPSEWKQKWNCEFDPIDMDVMDDDASDTEYAPLEGVPNFVPEYRSKVDILICTPGRLVEHIRTSKGFTLDHVKWLVVDEVDRLLDQSFQDWTRVVMPALEHNPNGMSVRDAILADMPWRSLKRTVRKVIASATITTDMEKLDALHLSRPRLVTLNTEGIPNDNNTRYQIPTTLREETQPIRDVIDKPLVLSRILTQIIEEQKQPLQSAKQGTTSPLPNRNARKDRLCQSSDISMSDESTSSSGSVTSSSSDDDSDSSISSSVAVSSASSSASSSTSSSTSSTTRSGSSSRSAASRPVSASKAARTSLQASSDTHKPIPNEIQARSQNVLVFTSKNENAMRLARLLSILRPKLKIGTFTGTSRSSDREKMLSAFRKGQLQVLIASNLASRVLSISHLTHVVNYDIPNSAETYVHRVGRTARAGTSGTAITLLAHHEARWFWNDIGHGETIERQNKVVRGSPMSFDAQERKQYQNALDQLGDETRGT